MDILIRNMELPKACGECPFYHLEKVWHKGQYAHKCDAQLICELTYESEPKKLSKDCPLVALPEHGTLKDTDFMLSCLEEIKKDYPEAYKLVSGIIERTPTIVEAST